jgi:uncharacterized membrane protein YhaH (DUF805 family)
MEAAIDDLRRCFLSFRGALSRKAFVLALIALVLVNWLLARWLSLALSTNGPIYYGAGQQAAARAIVNIDELLAALILLWPNLAISVKRWRDIGLPVRYFIFAQIGLFVAMLVSPGFWTIIVLAAGLALVFAPTASGRAAR